MTLFTLLLPLLKYSVCSLFISFILHIFSFYCHSVSRSELSENIILLRLHKDEKRLSPANPPGCRKLTKQKKNSEMSLFTIQSNNKGPPKSFSAIRVLIQQTSLRLRQLQRQTVVLQKSHNAHCFLSWAKYWERPWGRNHWCQFGFSADLQNWNNTYCSSNICSLRLLHSWYDVPKMEEVQNIQQTVSKCERSGMKGPVQRSN